MMKKYLKNKPFQTLLMQYIVFNYILAKLYIINIKISFYKSNNYGNIKQIFNIRLCHLKVFRSNLRNNPL